MYSIQTKKLERFLQKTKKQKTHEIIYGLYDNSGESLFTRLNDFVIDHTPVSLREKVYFFELLGTMLKAGIPLLSALKVLAKKTENQRLTRVIHTLAYHIGNGESLSHSLDRFPTIFHEVERGVIRSSEAIGGLDQILIKLAASLNAKHELVMRVQSALLYPVIVVIALISAASVMLTWVIPKIADIFRGEEIALPLSTQILLKMSETFREYWWVFLIVILLGILGFHVYNGTEEGHFSWDLWKLRFPFVGNILRKIIVTRFVDTLGLLIDSGLPLNRALEFVAGSLGNEVYRLKTYEVLTEVQHGKKLAHCLETAPFLFPEAVTNMIAVGERSASLAEISRKIAEHFEQEVDHTLKNLTTVMGPLVILIVGILVAFFALAVLSPIFSLTQAIR